MKFFLFTDFFYKDPLLGVRGTSQEKGKVETEGRKGKDREGEQRGEINLLTPE